MPRYCCIPNCNSNKPGGSYTTSFRFPKNELMKNKWLKCIPRDFTPSKDSVVCINHFEKDMIILVDKITSKDGKVTEYKRNYPKLSDEAYPTIFPNCPNYLNKKVTVRYATIERKKKMQKLDEDLLYNFLDQDKINSLSDIAEELKKENNRICIFLKDNNVNIHHCAECIHFLFIKCDKYVEIVKSVQINTNLQVTVFTGKKIINNFDSILTNNTLSCWGELENILTNVKNYEIIETQQNNVDNYSKSIEFWKLFLDENSNSEINDLITFILEQMQLAKKSVHGRNYSSNLIIFAYCVYIRSTACYLYLYNSKLLCLPSLRHLKRISANLKVSPGIATIENQAFLKEKCDKLKQHEKVVNLLIDEIYIKQSISYKAHKLVGFAKNSENQATTIQAFMYTSVFSKNKEIVSLVPVNRLNADTLFLMVKEVLLLMENIGFRVISIISDNNRINRNMFTKLCGTELKISINHPYNNSQKLFLLFDTVHLVKSIRNNWLSQINKIFYFPNPYNFTQILEASFTALEYIYEKEKDSVLKSAPKLSNKCLHPTSIEKQNVSLALKIFDKTNSVSLKSFGETLNNYPYSTTGNFIELINTWWEIVNIKHPKKGYNIRLKEGIPFTSINDERINFLEMFSDWVNTWRNLKQKTRHGGLSSETFFALSHTTRVFVELIKYLLTEVKAKYVLTGKFQTDNLEARFGQYRQMSGSNYYISVQQILEAEKKLRIKSILKFHSESHGEIGIKEFISAHTDNKIVEDVDISFYEPILENSNVESLSDNDIKVLVYIGGYCVKKLNILCEICKEFFMLKSFICIEMDNEEYNYLKELDRGGLKYPTVFVVDILSMCFAFFKNLVSKTYENEFKKCNNQFSVFVKLSILGIEIADIIPIINCPECDTSILSFVYQIVKTFSNVCLSNYVKQCNDNIQCEKDERKLKKLKT